MVDKQKKIAELIAKLENKAKRAREQGDYEVAIAFLNTLAGVQAVRNILNGVDDNDVS